jgi:hypothetical protein
VVIDFSVERSESLIMWSQEGGQHDLHWVRMKAAHFDNRGVCEMGTDNFPFPASF